VSAEDGVESPLQIWRHRLTAIYLLTCIRLPSSTNILPRITHSPTTIYNHLRPRPTTASAVPPRRNDTRSDNALSSALESIPSYQPCLTYPSHYGLPCSCSPGSFQSAVRSLCTHSLSLRAPSLHCYCYLVSLLHSTYSTSRTVFLSLLHS
jgi:hypothetical protein